MADTVSGSSRYIASPIRPLRRTSTSICEKSARYLPRWRPSPSGSSRRMFGESTKMPSMAGLKQASIFE